MMYATMILHYNPDSTFNRSHAVSERCELCPPPNTLTPIVAPVPAEVDGGTDTSLRSVERALLVAVEGTARECLDYADKSFLGNVPMGVKHVANRILGVLRDGPPKPEYCFTKACRAAVTHHHKSCPLADLRSEATHPTIEPKATCPNPDFDDDARHRKRCSGWVTTGGIDPQPCGRCNRDDCPNPDQCEKCGEPRHIVAADKFECAQNHHNPADVERVARAMILSNEWVELGWDDFDEAGKDTYRRMARAAIEAMPKRPTREREVIGEIVADIEADGCCDIYAGSEYHKRLIALYDKETE